MDNIVVDRSSIDMNFKTFYTRYDNISLDYLLAKSINKIEIHFNNIYIWCPTTLNWKIRNIDDAYFFIKKNMLSDLNNLEIEYCQLNKNSELDVKIRNNLDDLKNKLKDCTKEIKKILVQIKSTECKSLITFNNQFPFLIGFGDKYILDLKNKEKRIREYNDYFLYNIEYRSIKSINEICYPISEWFHKDNLQHIQLILGSFLTGEHDQTFYIFYGEGGNGKTMLLNILQILLGDYFIFVTEDLFTNKTTLELEEKYKLINRRLVVLDIQETSKFSEPKLISLIEKYKNCSFILSVNVIPKFSFKYSTQRRLIYIPFEYTFKPTPIYAKDKPIKKYLEIDYDYVFSWLLEGCVKYINSYQTITTLVKDYIEKYSLFEEDIFERFIKEKVIKTTSVKDNIGFKDFYRIYIEHEEEMNSKLSDRLKEKEFIKLCKSKFNFKKIAKGNIFYNIKVKELIDLEESLEDILIKQNKIIYIQ